MMNDRENAQRLQDFITTPEVRTLEYKGAIIEKIAATETSGSKILNLKEFRVRSYGWSCTIPFEPFYISRIEQAILRQARKGQAPK